MSVNFMVKKETKLGFFYAVLSNIFGGLQPVIANLRPASLDSLIFSGMTALIQVLIFIPIFFLEKSINKINRSKKQILPSFSPILISSLSFISSAIQYRIEPQ